MDYDKHFTVMNYREENSLKQVNCDDFIPLFNQQNPDHPWAAVQVRTGLHNLIPRPCAYMYMYM